MKICQGNKVKKPKKFISKNIIIFVILFLCTFCFLFLISKNVKAGDYGTSLLGGATESGSKYTGSFLSGGATGLMSIIVKAPATDAKLDTSIWNDLANWAKNFSITKFYEETLKKYGSGALNAAVKAALRTIAYDTATYIGSGGKGQKPMFITEGWGEYLKNVADNAGGTFIETLGRKGYLKFNLCEPDPMVKAKIGLGLIQYQRPQKPACTFSQLVKNWDQSLSDPQFLNKFQDMFNPASNDLGIALTLQTGLIENQKITEYQKGLERLASKGWLNVNDLAGRQTSPPGEAERRLTGIMMGQYQYLGQFTGDALADAANVFLNQLGITLFNNLMGKIGEGKGTYTSPYSGDYGLSDYEAAPGSGGVAGAKAKFRQLLEPNFNERGDYQILAELTSCTNPQKAGPTNCVIDEKFRQAIENKITVGQALKDGYLMADGIFGFKAHDMEPKYNEDKGYPYRSMIILRKFRIIPVGWEVAAEYINDKLAVSNQTLFIKDLIDCFSSSDDYVGYYASWCDGLVDPSWVLKAPQNYCKREGFGPEKLSEQVVGEGLDSELAIARADNYCADEQSCIKEAPDGSCKAFGYCTEERRKWSFNTKPCTSLYNTCQTFRSEQGQTVSYLKNTLDYGNCNAGNVGCKDYCTNYDYAGDKYNCTTAIDPDNKLYLDKDAEECDADGEGCHEFLRVSQGANLLKNSSFENLDAAGAVREWAGAGTSADGGYHGSKFLALTSTLNKSVEINDADDSYTVAGQAFSLSFYAKDCSGSFKIDGQTVATLIGLDSNWQRYETSYAYPATAVTDLIDFSINTLACKIDAIKLEFGSQATAYSDYGSAGKTYVKLAPGYLDCTTTPAPLACSDFARFCTKDEVGCEMFTSNQTKISVPARVTAEDYCAAECVGYNMFLGAETNFRAQTRDYFIPKTAKTCSASSVGCEQFTNLDEVARGGEGREYYSNLRQCQKPSDPGSNCTEFYTWEGSDESGFQLKVNSLVALGSGLTAQPVVTQADNLECNQIIYNLAPTDPSYNPDCRQYYNRQGGISYHLSERTKVCSEDCHPYRLTDSGTTCANGGVYDTDQGACIFMAIPGQGTTCTAAQAGCREYSGNTGNNMRTILNYDFESGSVQGWQGGEYSNVSITVNKHSLWVNDANNNAVLKIGNLVEQDKSYVLSFIARKNTATNFTEIKFNNGTNVSKFDLSGAPTVTEEWKFFKFNLEIGKLDQPVSEQETLEIRANNSFYIDNIRLIEISDRYYLIKNSWKTPAVCDQTDQGAADLHHAVGCDAYQDRNKKVHNLHNFSQLCSESAVGCELMIDTYNSTNYAQEIFNAPDPASIETVPADNYDYVVYDKKKLCNQADKGCTRLGVPYQYDGQVVYGDTYLKNDPDEYDEILCDSSTLNCGQYAGDNDANYYFKDPGDQICEYGQAHATSTEGWYKKEVKRCDDGSHGGLVNGQIDVNNTTSPVVVKENQVCLKDSNCNLVAGKADVKCKSDEDCRINICLATKKCSNTGESCAADKDCRNITKCSASQCHYGCIIDKQDYACTTTGYKTIGLGGAGNQVNLPTADAAGNSWVGLCTASESTCTEYIDPVSRFNSNLIFNADFSQNVDGLGGPDGWEGNDQEITLENFTLYRLAHQDHAGNLKITCDKTLLKLDDDNKLVSQGLSLTLNLSQTSRLIYSGENTDCDISVTSTSGKVELKKVALDYQLASGIDSGSCNGIVDFEQGCVLFNQRSQTGKTLASLDYDADLTINDGNGVAPKPEDVAGSGENDSNTILKVSPDRVCDKWLACKSYALDEKGKNVCYDVGICNGANDVGECKNFVVIDDDLKNNYLAKDFANPAIVSLPAATVDAGQISNYSGYSKVGYFANGSLMNDYYYLGEMKQTGEVAEVSNGGFEYAGSNGYPIGWRWEGGSWTPGVFKVVNNPIEAQEEAVNYAPEGRSFLKLGSTFSATSEMLDVSPNTEYILTAYINTKNLKSGSAQATIKIGSDTIIPNPAVSLEYGNDWTFKLGTFTTGNNVTNIEVLLDSDSDTTQGNYYFDDIKIKPALESRKDLSQTTINKWLTPQSCRLYPQSDSLSCEYYEDSGKRQKGWLGYCLEYDRAPGAEDACLLWWPVDKVKGDGIEEGKGYADRFPLYLCLEANAVCSGESNLQAQYYCNKLVKVVGDVGQNKYWSSHVYEGSDYEYPYSIANKKIDWSVKNEEFPYSPVVTEENISINYSREVLPFGAMVPPFPSSNPNEWDGITNTETNTDIQPVYAYQPGTASGKARAGTPYYGPDVTCSITEKTRACRYAYCYSKDENHHYIVCPKGYFASDVRGCGSGSDWSWKRTYDWTPDPDDDSHSVKFTSSLPGNVPTGCYTTEGSDNSGSECCQITCTQIYNYNIAGSLSESIESAKRLFAKSYGAWEWTGNKLCSGGIKNGQPCVKDTDCSGSCEPRCVSKTAGTIVAIGGTCDQAITNDCEKYASKASCSEKRCTGGGCMQGFGCTTDAYCRTCPDGTKLTDTNIKCTAEVGKECNGGAKANQPCTNTNPGCRGCLGQTYGQCNVSTLKKCYGGNKENLNCTAAPSANRDYYCKGCGNYSLGYCKNSSGKCSGGSCNTNKLCNNNADCLCSGGTNGTCSGSNNVKECSGGSCKIGTSCSANSDCTCTGGTNGTCGPTCVGGNREGQVCSNAGGVTADCNTACTNYNDGTCENTCSGDSTNPRYQLSCQTDAQCNCTGSALSTCSCTGYNTGDCVQKKVCAGGCNNTQSCTADAGKCTTGSCFECEASTCSNGTSCANNAASCSGVCGQGHYTASTDLNLKWGPPTNLCLGGSRPADPPSDYCAILPMVGNVKVNNMISGDVNISKSQFVNLTFTSVVDSQQLPLVMYKVKWGDGEETVVSGVEMQERKNPDNPHSLYHLYSYWDLKARAARSVAGSNIDCSQPNNCTVKPTVQIKDNWGWCNGGTAMNICTYYEPFASEIVVWEK